MTTFFPQEHQQKIEQKIQPLLQQPPTAPVIPPFLAVRFSGGITDTGRQLSTTLASQIDCLHEKTLIISNGYLFTVRQDRPILVPFEPADANFRGLADQYLSDFETSVIDLLHVIDKKWPYHYRKEVVMDYYGTDAKQQRRFVESLSLVISKSTHGQVDIMMQDPSYDRPHMLPLGMEDAYEQLLNKEKPYLLDDWMLPEIQELQKIIKDLYAERIFTDKDVQGISTELVELVELWQVQLIYLYQQNQTKVIYNQIKSVVMKNWLILRNKKKDTVMSRRWDTVLARYFNRPLNDIRQWLRNVPGMQRVWFDREQGYMVIGGLVPLKNQLLRQPSIRQWHALQGDLDVELLLSLVDVDWVRMNQFAGNPCVATLIKRWQEINFNQLEALIPVSI